MLVGSCGLLHDFAVLCLQTKTPITGLKLDELFSNHEYMELRFKRKQKSIYKKLQAVTSPQA